MAKLWNNDDAIAFFAANGYPTEYNDGMLAWLRAYFSTTHFTLNDLLHRYTVLHGDDFLPVGGTGFILQEDGSFLLQETGDKLIIEG